MAISDIEEILNQYKQGTLSLNDALKTLKWYPFVEKENLTLDTQRCLRRGFPEIVYAKGKSIKTLKEILKNSGKISFKLAKLFAPSHSLFKSCSPKSLKLALKLL